jgi:hypothetical protein
MAKWLGIFLVSFLFVSGMKLYGAHNITEDAVQSIGAEGINELIDAARSLSPEDDEIRIKAIKRLGELKAKDATDVLIEVLETKRMSSGGREIYNWRLKVVAAKALADINDPKAVFYLASMLRKDDDVTVKRAAAQALGLMGESARKKGVLEVMHAEIDRTRDNALVSDICEALGKIGDKSSFVYLLRVTQGPYLNYVKETAQKGIASTKWDKASVFEEGSTNESSVSKYNK